MFSRKNRSSCSTPGAESPPCSPLPQLQQLTVLQSQLISILGRRNVVVDESADIFTRLEDVYLSSLQGSPLGLETLEKCLRVVGGCDSPARVRFLYLCAHQMMLKGAAVDEVEPVLLQAFHSTLALRHKVDLGFKSALAFCQVSEHAAEVDKILSSLVVALEQELGYRPQRKPKAHPSGSTAAFNETKAIYLGVRSVHKTAANTHPHGRAQKLQLFKMLFEGFVTGSWRVQSEARRKYYQECREELRARLIREFPGREMEKKLASIEERRSVALGELSSFLDWGAGRPETAEERPSNTQTQTHTRTPSHSKSSSKLNPRSKSQAASSAGFQSLKASFVRDPQANTWGTSTPARQSSFKLHIRKSSKGKPAPSQAESEARQEQPLEVTKLVFRENTENVKPPSSKGKQTEGKASKCVEGPTRGLVLKFDRLQHEKAEVKKKKLRHTFTWDKDKSHKENQQQLQHVIDIQCLPQIVEEPPQPRPQASLQVSPRLTLHNQAQPQHSITNPSTSELNSARRIDQLLKEGVEWIAHLESEPSRPVISNAALSECEPLQPHRPEQSFSDTQLISEAIAEEPDEGSREASYKIVIRPLEKPQVNLIIAEEVLGFLHRLGEAVIGREASRCEGRRRESRPSKCHKYQPMKQCEVSIEIRKQANNDSECEQVEATAQLQRLETLEKREGVPFLKEALAVERSSDLLLLPTEGIEEEVKQDSSEYRVDLQAEAQIDDIKAMFLQAIPDLLEEEQMKKDVYEWLMRVQEEVILQSISLQPLQEQPSLQTTEQTGAKPSQQDPQPLPHSLPALPLSRIKCSIKAEHPSSSSRSDSVDDKQLSSEINSCPSIEQAQLQVSPPFEQASGHVECEVRPCQLLSPFAEEREVSHFTCSRFAGSKIDTEKESDFEWRSQMNFMNEIFKSDRIEEDLPLLQIPENRRDSRCLHPDESEEVENDSRNYRSRTQSQISNKSSSRNVRESVSSRSLRREKTHDCLSFSYSDNYDAVTHTSKKFNHWLSPELRVSHHRLAFVLVADRGELVREVSVPGFVVVNDDTVRAVSGKAEKFLARFAVRREMGAEEWEGLGRELEEVDLLPDEAELPSLNIHDKDGQEDEIRCVANLKSLRIVLQSTKMFLKVNPVAAYSMQELEAAVVGLDAARFSIQSSEILVKGLWTFTGQRNIKLREKSESAVSHLVFDVLERYSEGGTFDYCVREQSGESLTFEGIQPSRRTKIVRNMDTIIGFCLKSVDGKVRLNTNNLKQFLSLL